MTVAPNPSTGCAKVRDVVAAIATVAVAPWSGKVYRARAYPLMMDALPAVLVYGYDETLTFVSMNASDYQGTDICQMVVQIMVVEASPEAAEAALETLIGAIRSSVIQSQQLLGENGEIERIITVKTTRNIKAQSDDVTGEAHIVFEMQWSEEYWLREDHVNEIDVIITMFGQPILEIDIPIVP